MEEILKPLLACVNAEQFLRLGKSESFPDDNSVKLRLECVLFANVKKLHLRYFRILEIFRIK